MVDESTKLHLQQKLVASAQTVQEVVLHLPGVAFPLWVTVDSSSPVARHVAPAKTSLYEAVTCTRTAFNEKNS